MTSNITLQRAISESWIYDVGSALWYLEISGVRVAEIDSSGMKLKGDVITNEPL